MPTQKNTGWPAAFRRHAGAVMTDSFFKGLSRVGRLHPSARPERHDVEVLRDVAYTDSGRPEHRLDVYRPLAVSRGELSDVPVVLYVHGGSFRILSKDSHWMMGLAYARRGYVVFNISYRLAPRHRFPAAIEDACAAYEWVVNNAARFGGDLDRMVLAGESAGGNLVTSLAIAASYRRDEPWARRVFDANVRARAVVAACGMLEVTNGERFRRRWPHMSGFIQDRIVEVGDAYVGERDLPAFFIPCGTKDPLIDDAQRLAAALDVLGVEHEARYYAGEPHAFHALVVTKNALRCWKHTYQFLDRYVGPAPFERHFRASFWRPSQE
jgi:acetyl esterase